MEKLLQIIPLLLLLALWLPNVIKALTIVAKQIPQRIWKVAGIYAIAVLFAAAGYNAYNEIEQIQERTSTISSSDSDVEPEDDADPSRSPLDMLYDMYGKLVIHIDESNNGDMILFTSRSISNAATHILANGSSIYPLDDIDEIYQARDGPLFKVIDLRDGYFNTS